MKREAEELIKFLREDVIECEYHCGCGKCDKLTDLTNALELSLSPSPQPSATADEKTDHDLSKIADDWATNMPVNTGIRTAFVHGYKYAVKPVAEREVPMRADVKTYLEAKSKNAGWLNFRHFLHGVGYGTEETIIAWVEQYCAGVMAEREVPEEVVDDKEFCCVCGRESSINYNGTLYCDTCIEEILGQKSIRRNQ